MAIYCENFKDAAPSLLKYVSLVRDLAKQKGDWLQYDKSFRQTKCQLQVTWANMHHALWLTSMINGQNNVVNSNDENEGLMNKFQVPTIPNSYCIRYHKCHYCQLPCRYNHECFKCNRLHPSYKCWQQQKL